MMSDRQNFQVVPALSRLAADAGEMHVGTAILLGLAETPSGDGFHGVRPGRRDLIVAETVTRRLVHLEEAVGLDCVLMGMHRPGIAQEDVFRSIDLTGNRVIPAVRARLRS